ncbi:MAG: hypothetical protein ABSA83_09935 [Verrucomicrobiota bacterium]|jgi:hypothetical protein
MRIRTAFLFVLFLFTAVRLRADQVQMQNGDRYAGKVISMTANAVVLQSDVLGRITLPRGKVAAINLGAVVQPPASGAINQTRAVSLVLTNANPDIAAALRQLGGNTNFIEQIRKQFLSEAGPEANDKFDETVAGLMSGKIDMNSLRAQAKSAADQIRSLKSQGDVGEPLDSYLAILDNFLKQIPPSAPATNRIPPAAATR